MCRSGNHIFYHGDLNPALFSDQGSGRPSPRCSLSVSHRCKQEAGWSD